LLLLLDSCHRLDHMQQLPEQVRHLLQRAGDQSTSADDEPVHAWQKCPHRRQLDSKHRQGNTSCFSGCTVQYVIDRSLSSAREESTHSLPTDGKSDSVTSPSTKQPRLDVVEFCAVQFHSYHMLWSLISVKVICAEDQAARSPILTLFVWL